MDIWQLISKDLDFDNSYGDITIVGDQLYIPNSRDRVLKQVVIDRVKSSFGDYPLNPGYGADADSYFGKGISVELVEKLKASMQNSLVSDGFISSSSLEIMSLIKENTVYIRIYLITSENTRVSVAVTYSAGDLRIE